MKFVIVVVVLYYSQSYLSFACYNNNLEARLDDETGIGIKSKKNKSFLLNAIYVDWFIYFCFCYLIKIQVIRVIFLLYMSS